MCYSRHRLENVQMHLCTFTMLHRELMHLCKTLNGYTVYLSHGFQYHIFTYATRFYGYFCRPPRLHYRIKNWPWCTSAFMRRSSIWCSSVRPMITPGGTPGQETPSLPTHDASGATWNGLGRWPPRPGMREERERERERERECVYALLPLNRRNFLLNISFRLQCGDICEHRSWWCYH